MKKIDKMIAHIKEEIDGACDYAEKYNMYKTTHPQWAQMYHDMSAQELAHADYLKTMAQEKIDTFSYIPEEAMEKWEKCMKKIVEKKAVVKLMLTK